MIITVFTPTYNREKYLPRLYDSLLNQKNKNFEWLIVDDGSSDGTKDLIEKYKNENKIKIKYAVQDNSGKHVAFNLGVKLCDTELFFCVDSDDFLPPNSIEDILEIWSTERCSNNIGIVALKNDCTNHLMCKEMPSILKSSTLSDLYNKHGQRGETALIFLTKVLKKNLFPCFKGEKFLSEEVLYNKLDEIGSLIILNKVVYTAEYLDEGITCNYVKSWKSSPNGVLLLLKSRYKRALTLSGIRKIYRLCRVTLVMNAFCRNMKIDILKNAPNKALSILLYLPSIIVEIIKFK